ncbi:AIPR family protein [Crossiella equi]|nr:AIPR family protein [Crossiella equi]
MDRILEGLNEQFRNEHDLASLKPDELFEVFCAYTITRSIFEDEFNPEELCLGGGGDLGIDAAAVLINGELLTNVDEVVNAVQKARTVDAHFVIVQSKTSSSFDGKVITDLADNLVELFASNKIGYPASSDIADLKRCIEAVYSNVGKLKPLPRLNVYYATSGRVTDDEHLSAKTAKAEDRLDQTELFVKPRVHLLGSRELREMYQRATTAVSAEFSMEKRLSVPKIAGVEQAFLGLLPASELVKIISDPSGGIRRSVFFENVRDFQGDNAVNQEIRKTLQDADRCERFAVLNNGVTIVAREIQSAGDDLKVSGFQVVNGCQTCHVLFEERETLGEAVWVPVKLIESKDDDIISGIIAATNRQTAVSDEDLEAKEQFHKDLEELFNSFGHDERLYYERRSGQYTPQSIEKTRIVSRGQLTRAFASVFLGEAARAGRSYKDLRESRKDELFNEEQSPYAYYASAVVAYRVEWLIRNKKIDRKFGPAKYHLMEAFKSYLIGDAPLQRSAKKAERQCTPLVEVAWDQEQSLRVTEVIIEAVERAVAKAHNAGLIRDFFRSQQFTAALNEELAVVRPLNTT